MLFSSADAVLFLFYIAKLILFSVSCKIMPSFHTFFGLYYVSPFFFYANIPHPKSLLYAFAYIFLVHTKI